MSWLTRTRTEPTVELPTVQPDTCAACHVGTEALTEINLPGMDRVPVCTDPSACRQRAQLLGIYCRAGGAL